MKVGMTMNEPIYKRILLKISGEALAGDKGFGIDNDTVANIAKEIKGIVDLGVEVIVVVGGGNIWRGANQSASGIDRSTADYMGMLATIMNSLAIQGSLERIEVPTRVQTSIEMREVAEPFIRRKAMAHLDKGRVVIFGGGTGNPFFSTDTAAALRAAEMGCEVILMAKKVDGVYDMDPNEHPEAKMYQEISFREVLNQGLKVMDATAASLCMENDINLLVFNLTQEGNIMKAICGEHIGTVVGRKL
jgi:uridylate kinase